MNSSQRSRINSFMNQLGRFLGLGIASANKNDTCSASVSLRNLSRLKWFTLDWQVLIWVGFGVVGSRETLKALWWVVAACWFHHRPLQPWWRSCSSRSSPWPKLCSRLNPFSVGQRQTVLIMWLCCLQFDNNTHRYPLHWSWMPTSVHSKIIKTFWEL